MLPAFARVHSMMTARSILQYGLACVLVGFATITAAEPADPKVKQSAEELARLREKIDAVSQSIEADRSRKDSLQTAVEAAERKLGEARAQTHRLAAQIDQQTRKVQQARDAQTAAEADLARQKDALARQLRAAYVLGTGGRTELLLSQDHPDELGRMLAYYGYLSHARKTYIDDINDQIAQAAALEVRYQGELADLHSLQLQQRQNLAEIETDRTARQQAVQEVQTRLSGEDEELKQLRGSEKQLQALLESLKRALVSAPPPSLGKSLPQGRGHIMQWPLRGTLLADYGDAKAGGRLQWKGLWIEAAEGTPVHAAAAGRVAYVGWLSSFGLIVVIEHQKGLFTLYGHNATVGKAVGDTVDAGEVIASAGNTGGYEQTGLYFEVRKGTDPEDPKDWLVK